jgi:hypothetical protein
MMPGHLGLLYLRDIANKIAFITNNKYNNGLSYTSDENGILSGGHSMGVLLICIWMECSKHPTLTELLRPIAVLLQLVVAQICLIADSIFLAPSTTCGSTTARSGQMKSGSSTMPAADKLSALLPH